MSGGDSAARAFVGRVVSDALTAAAYTLADRAAVADIETEGIAVADEHGRRWYDTRPMVDLREVPADWAEMSRQTIDYALARGLVSPHPAHAGWVRITGGRAT